MLFILIAFVRLQPIAVRRGERPKRGRPTTLLQLIHTDSERRRMQGDECTTYITIQLAYQQVKISTAITKLTQQKKTP